MIEKYYASHIKTMLDAAAINVRKPRKPARPTKSATAAKEKSRWRRKAEKPPEDEL